jgi:predicted NAD/FAD-binding protein
MDTDLTTGHPVRDARGRNLGTTTVNRIAVVGSGIAGLSAAYLLSRRHHVTLYERDRRLGGHTNTVTVDAAGGPVALDTGFLVHNSQTYPNLVRLLDELRIDTQDSDMSFSVRCAATGFEYSSRGIDGFFAHRRNLVRPGHYALLRDIARFNREAPGVLETGSDDDETLGDYLAERRYGHEFVARYLTPMASAIWSSTLDDIKRFPVRVLVRFMQNHGLLAMRAHPTWRVVRGGSARYIPKLTAPLGNRIHLGARLTSIGRSDAGVRLTFEDRPPEHVDAVVVACHGAQVLPLLADPTHEERQVFSNFTTTANEAWLHTDADALPRAVRARASWNYRLGAGDHAPSITYDLNRLQGITGPVQYCVTLNPSVPLDERTVIGRYTYHHPRMTTGAIAAQGRWRSVSGVGGIHYCGAYWRYGFHEDGLLSAIRVAADLGVAW